MNPSVVSDMMVKINHDWLLMDGNERKSWLVLGGGGWKSSAGSRDQWQGVGFCICCVTFLVSLFVFYQEQIFYRYVLMSQTFCCDWGGGEGGRSLTDTFQRNEKLASKFRE